MINIKILIHLDSQQDISCLQLSTQPNKQLSQLGKFLYNDEKINFNDYMFVNQPIKGLFDYQINNRNSKNKRYKQQIKRDNIDTQGGSHVKLFVQREIVEDRRIDGNKNYRNLDQKKNEGGKQWDLKDLILIFEKNYAKKDNKKNNKKKSYNYSKTKKQTKLFKNQSKIGEILQDLYPQQEQEFLQQSKLERKYIIVLYSRKEVVEVMIRLMDKYKQERKDIADGEERGYMKNIIDTNKDKNENMKTEECCDIY